MVTPFKFRAVTSRPRGKCRSILLTGGVVSGFLSQPFSGSSRVIGDLLMCLWMLVGFFRYTSHASSAIMQMQLVDGELE